MGSYRIIRAVVGNVEWERKLLEGFGLKGKAVWGLSRRTPVCAVWMEAGGYCCLRMSSGGSGDHSNSSGVVTSDQVHICIGNVTDNRANDWIDGTGKGSQTWLQEYRCHQMTQLCLPLWSHLVTGMQRQRGVRVSANQAWPIAMLSEWGRREVKELIRYAKKYHNDGPNSVIWIIKKGIHVMRWELVLEIVTATYWDPTGRRQINQVIDR